MRVVAVVGLVAACHGSHPATGDAPSPSGDAPPMMADAAPDVVDATPRGMMTVIVYGDGIDRGTGMLVPGADVYFVEPDTTVTKIVTGTDGVATAQEPNGTTVWAVHRDGTNDYAIETFEGVRIGDTIISGNPTPPPNDNASHAYLAFGSFSDATIYNAMVSCGNGPTPSSASPIAQSFSPCGYETTANALVWATDSMGNLGYTTATGVDLTAHVSAGTALSLPAFQTGATIAVTFTNLPSAMGESNADIRARYMTGADPTFLQDVELRPDTLTDTMTASTAIAPVGDRTRILGQVYIATNAYGYSYDGPVAGLQSSVTIDASAMVHPAKTWTYHAATTSITWTQQPFGADPTTVESTISWNNNGLVRWYLLAPYSGSASLALPTAPSDLATILPSPELAAFEQVNLTSYPGKTYHDALVGQVGDTASWRIGVGP